MSARSALRTATADDHERVDAIFGSFRLEHQAGYRAFLRATAAAYLPVEAALDAAGAERVVEDWEERRRADLIRSDLVALGEDATLMTDPPRLDGEGSLLGAIYVLEGSRLGGALLSRQLAPGAPRRFLAAPSAPGAWRRLIEVLDLRLTARDELARATLVAKQIFGRFAAAGLDVLEPAK